MLSAKRVVFTDQLYLHSLPVCMKHMACSIGIINRCDQQNTICNAIGPHQDIQSMLKPFFFADFDRFVGLMRNRHLELNTNQLFHEQGNKRVTQITA